MNKERHKSGLEKGEYNFCLNKVIRSGSICFSLDLTEGRVFGRSMAWFDFRVENGHGVGTALIVMAKEILKDHGAKDLLIKGVRKTGNEANFYQNLNLTWQNLKSGNVCKYGQGETVTVGEILLQT